MSAYLWSQSVQLLPVEAPMPMLILWAFVNGVRLYLAGQAVASQMSFVL